MNRSVGKTKRSGHTIAWVRAEFAAKGLELLDEAYKSSSVLMNYRCEQCDYIGRVRFNDLPRSFGCKSCSLKLKATRQKLDFQKFKQAQRQRGIEVVSTVYVNSQTKLQFLCVKCRHVWSTAPNHVRRGSGCPRCYHIRSAKNRTYTCEFVRKELVKRRITLLSDYRTSNGAIRVRFDLCGHEGPTTWSQIQSGHGCRQCAPNARVTEAGYREIAEKFGGKMLEMGSRAQRLSKWQCALGHLFHRSLTSIRFRGTFCTECSGSYAEMLCRVAVEKMFSRTFRSLRMRGMNSPKGVPLEFDIYNDELKLAVEHHGPHHYEPQENWSGGEGLRLQRVHDSRRRRYCKANGILLIEIRELGKRTSLEGMRRKILSALSKAGRDVPSTVKTADLAHLPLLNESQIYWSEVQQAARRIGLEILGRVYLGADEPIQVRCEMGHVTPKRPRLILRGQGCHLCYLERIRKPLRASDGRVFASGTIAAKALGVTKEAVNTAVRKGVPVRGVKFERILLDDFLKNAGEAHPTL